MIDVHKENSILNNCIKIQHTSIKRRQFLWDEASKLVDFDLLDHSIKEINLEGLLEVYPKMLKGETSGRYIINLNM